MYLRFAVLLPLGTQRVEIRRGDKTWMNDLKPGFVMPYVSITKEESLNFGVFIDSQKMGDFKLDPKRSPGFYTAVVIVRSGNPELVFMEDNPPPPSDAEFNFESRRLRAYLPAMGFPYTVDAGNLGKWDVAKESVVVDCPITTDAPPTVSLNFISKDDDKVKLYFPIDFKNHSKNSIFVSQRGFMRPRIQCLPDNVTPTDDPAAPQ